MAGMIDTSFHLPQPLYERAKAVSGGGVALSAMIAVALQDHGAAADFTTKPLAASIATEAQVLLLPLPGALLVPATKTMGIGDAVARALYLHFDKLDRAGTFNHSISLPRDTFARLEADAARQGVTPDDLIRRALSDYLFSPVLYRIEANLPADDTPHSGGCRIGRDLAARMSFVMPQHTAETGRGNGTLMIARAVQIYLDARPPLPPAPEGPAMHEWLHRQARHGKKVPRL
jgi:hypothetical protein